MRKELLFRGKQSLKHAVMSALLPSFTIRLFVLHQWFFGEPELRLISSLVKPWQTSVDVGANFGLYSFLCARYSRSVIAYEPNPELAAFLFRAMPENVMVRTVGVSTGPGYATLSLPEIDGVEMASRGSIEPDPIGGHRTFRVETVCLDDEGIEKVGFIKIDVEGHEEKVLEGAEKLLARDRPNLLIEIEQRHHREDISRVFQRIIELNYDGWFLAEGKRRPLEDFSVERDQTAYLSNLSSPSYIHNFIFQPR